MIIFVKIMRKIFLATLSGLLLAFSWPPYGFFILIFFAFIPLLILQKEIRDQRKTIELMLYVFLSFLIFNIITTYWIWHSTLPGALFAFFLNSFLMTLCFYFFNEVSKNVGARLACLFFIFIWLSFEYIHFNWDLSWPWLTLGNVFSETPSIVQWYEYTGVMGGSLWILIINITLYNFILKRRLTTLIFLFFYLIVPITISFLLINDIDEEKNLNVLVVQPNIDPYKEKFSISFKDQIDDFILLAESGLTQETELLIGPETALTEGIWEDKNNQYNRTYSINALKELQKKYPRLNILVGATTYKSFNDQDNKSSTARQINNSDIFYDVYNSAVFISQKEEVKIYHKTKLVPGAEKTPFPKLFDKLADLMINLGGISGSLGSVSTNQIFDINNHIIQPLICYESIYGNLGSKNSSLISVITNDGWWKNTSGYMQHFSYARLRAIEQRKSIVRSANTGLSGFINKNGYVTKRTNWDEKVVIQNNVGINNTQTFYSFYGDYIGRVSAFFSFMILLIIYIKQIILKNNYS